MKHITELSTPCFILDEKELTESIKDFQKALDEHFEHSIIGYSVKTNSIPYCLKIAKDNGCYAEVVSYHEYKLACLIGFPKDKIVYNGPLKSKETFLEAIQNGAIVNIECWREIDWLKELPQNKTYEIGIRVNINISTISPNDQFHDDDDSRFGFSYESGDLKKAIEQISLLKNIKIIGIHSHREPCTRSIQFYKNVMQYVQNIISEYGLHLTFWSLGGGFFGRMPNKPTYKEYVKGFYDALSPELKNITIIVEPGNALVASAFDYISTVLDVKFHDNKYFVTTDGTRNDLDPFYRKSNYFTSYITTEAEEICPQKQVIGGLTCLENDRLFTIEENKPKLKVDDKIIYNRVGAYTACLSPLFIHYLPNVYLFKDNNYSLIREEWTEQEFVIKSHF